MKKCISILLFVSMLVSLSSCSDSSNESSEASESSVTEEPTEEPTTEEATEPTTVQIPTLDKEYTFEDMTFGAPMIANKIGSLPYGESTLTLINFYDSSEIQVSVSTNTSGISFSTVTSEELYQSLETYATSFASSYSEKSELEKVNINGAVAVKQTLKKDGELSKVFHAFYNDNAYTINFFDNKGDDSTIAMLIADDVIDSVKFNGADEKTTEEPTEKTTKAPKATEPPAPESNISTGQKNALKSAKSYIDLMGFSYQGLIDQLEYEGYSHDEAVYGADNCGADWFEEAAKLAQNVLSITPVSRDELLDQLLYEGFTQEQAEYGVQSVGY